MAELIQYTCPCCGGRVEFDSALQKMKCPYCDTVFDVEAMKDRDEVLSSAEQDSMDWQMEEQYGWDDSKMGVYTCKTCGGQILADVTTAATQCPYCNNPVMLTGRLSGDLKPDYVIPFKLDKEAAKAALKKFTSGKKLLPKVFSSENQLDEIKGVYVPFWLFDAKADADVRYHASRVRTWHDSRYDYTETSHFSLDRRGSLQFDHVPVDGASKLPNELMESLEPFDFSEAVDFQTAYLSGYMADRYDVDKEESINRANERIKRSTVSAFNSTTGGYVSVTPERTNIRLRDAKASYALYPVWLMNTVWRGQKYTFAMNGQTGKIVGDMPTDKGAYWKWRLIYTAIFGGGAFLLISLLTGLL